jgi:hypothetical protein
MSRFTNSNNLPDKTNNKVEVFLKYALLEIILVVAGILIALQINNWNESRLLNIQKKENLINLGAAIQKDADLLGSIETINDFRFNSIAQLLKWSKIKDPSIDSLSIALIDESLWNQAIPSLFDKEFFDLTITWISRPRIMIINSYAMEEIKSSGIYSKIKNYSLKKEINTYYSDLYWVFGNDSQSRNLVELGDYLRENYSLLISDLKFLNDPVEFIKQSPGLKVRIKSVMSRADWRRNRAKASRLQAERVIKMINDEISLLD